MTHNNQCRHATVWVLCISTNLIHVLPEPGYDTIALVGKDPGMANCVRYESHFVSFAQMRNDFALKSSKSSIFGLSVTSLVQLGIVILLLDSCTLYVKKAAIRMEIIPSMTFLISILVIFTLF